MIINNLTERKVSMETDPTERLSVIRLDDDKDDNGDDKTEDNGDEKTEDNGDDKTEDNGDNDAAESD